MLLTEEHFMKQALKEALNAYEADEVPVGAVVVCRNKIIGRGHNQTEKLHDVTAHAEMIAITAAANYLGSKFLDECTLYVTLEPCVMCAGALRWARIEKLVMGARDEKAGFLLTSKNILHPKTEMTTGVLETECGLLLKNFFKNKR